MGIGRICVLVPRSVRCDAWTGPECYRRMSHASMLDNGGLNVRVRVVVQAVVRCLCRQMGGGRWRRRDGAATTLTSALLVLFLGVTVAAQE
jgi:hypothetical protein